MTQRAGCFSADARVKRHLQGDYGHYNFPRLHAIDNTRARLPLPKWFSDVMPIPPKTTASFVFKWKDDDLFKSVWSLIVHDHSGSMSLLHCFDALQLS